MPKKREDGPSAWVDPDDAPELTDEWFTAADVYQGESLVSRGRGRPKLDATKQLVSLRLDADVIAGFRATGDGWQTRMNSALREWLERAH